MNNGVTSKRSRVSAGLLMFRRKIDILEFLLVHPGGPFWKNKDDGAWTIPKGEYLKDEQPLEAAKREFQEETGFPVSEPFLDLGAITQKGGKIVTAWAFEGDCDAEQIKSNLFSMEWPPKSGKLKDFPGLVIPHSGCVRF